MQLPTNEALCGAQKCSGAQALESAMRHARAGFGFVRTYERVTKEWNATRVLQTETTNIASACFQRCSGRNPQCQGRYEPENATK